MRGKRGRRSDADLSPCQLSSIRGGGDDGHCERKGGGDKQRRDVHGRRVRVRSGREREGQDTTQLARNDQNSGLKGER